MKGRGSASTDDRADPVRPSPQSSPFETSIRKFKSAGETVVVLGGGVAGLSAARMLAEAGCEVHVFEGSSACGGFCSTLSIEGFAFDLGPHIFQPTILRLVPVRPKDVDPQTFTESILFNHRMLRFPGELLSEGFVFDAVRTLVGGWFADSQVSPADFEEYARQSYGSRVTREIFKPLIEKWCASPLRDLATAYMASRMHGKVTTSNAVGFVSHHIRKFLPLNRPQPRAQVNGFPVAPGYSGHEGAVVIPMRLESGPQNLRIHVQSPVKSLTVKAGRITQVSAGNTTVSPDYVVNTIPLNVLASTIEGDGELAALESLSYLHIIFVMARIARPRVTNAKWVWVPSQALPFYRISEMKALGRQHAPADATGLCMELTMREDDPAFLAPDSHWTDMAVNFLDQALGIKKREIIGLTVVRRKYAYPLFTTGNTSILKRFLSLPYTMDHRRHDFKLPVANLGLAGRSGTFLYLMTPQAIRSGYEAATDALKYLEAQRT